MYGEVDSFSVIRFAHAVFQKIISLDVGYLIEVRDSRNNRAHTLCPMLGSCVAPKNLNTRTKSPVLAKMQRLKS